MTQSTALSLIQKWQKQLNLVHWTVGISTQLPDKGHEMEIVMTPVRQHAAIRINPVCYKYPTPRFEKLIIHELLHPLFDPMKREYERSDYQYSVAHFEHTMETSLDHLANVLYSLK